MSRRPPLGLQIVPIPKVLTDSDLPCLLRLDVTKGWSVSTRETLEKNGCEKILCALVTDGTCTACTSYVASGCTAVTCDAGYGNADADATNGCEVPCATVTDGTCTVCTSAVASGCTAVSCAPNKFDTNNDPTDGCEAGCFNVGCTACTSSH